MGFGLGGIGTFGRMVFNTVKKLPVISSVLGDEDAGLQHMAGGRKGGGGSYAMGDGIPSSIALV